MMEPTRKGKDYWGIRPGWAYLWLTVWASWLVFAIVASVRVHI